MTPSIRRLARSIKAGTLLMLCMSCTRGDSPSGMATTTDSAGIRIITIHAAPADVADWSLASAPDLTISAAQAKDSSAFAQIGSVNWLSDGSIIVADVTARRILVFDVSGRLVKSMGRAGEGPGEFRGLGAVRITAADSIIAFDRRLRRLSVFHQDTGFVRSIRLGGTSDYSWPEDAWFWRNNQIVVLQLSLMPLDSVFPRAGVRRWPTRARLTLTDSGGHVTATTPEFPGVFTALHDRGDGRVPFSNRPFAVPALDRVYFGSGSSFTLAFVDSVFKPAGEIRWPAQSEELTQAEIDAVRSEAFAIASKRWPADRLAALFATSFAPHIQPKERPAVGRVLVDAEGRIWVERFEATRLGSDLQKAGDRWTILAPTGEAVARLGIPSNSRLEATEGDRVLLVVRDSLDVQSVAVHTILRP